MTKIAIVADIDTVTCFKLAGVKHGYSVKNATEAERLILDIAQKPSFAVIVTTERIADEIPFTIERITREREYPLIIAVPDKRGAITRKVEPIAQLIKRTIGVEIKVG